MIIEHNGKKWKVSRVAKSYHGFLLYFCRLKDIMMTGNYCWLYEDINTGDIVRQDIFGDLEAAWRSTLKSDIC